MALWVWYRGEHFRGFQAQVQGPTVQQELARALATLGISSNPAPAGRTDLGVHARMQVVSLHTGPTHTPETLLAELPPLLPQGLGLCAAARPPASFHAQWSCSGKQYRYRIRLSASAPHGWDACSWYPQEHPRLAGRSLHPERLASILTRAAGRRDFIAFHAKSSPRKLRTLQSVQLVELPGGLLDIHLSGDGFARYQVRYLVGSAVATAAGDIPEESFFLALETGEPISGIRAPPQGLVLWETRYSPGLDPFAQERASAPNLPQVPPFYTPLPTAPADPHTSPADPRSPLADTRSAGSGSPATDP